MRAGEGRTNNNYNMKKNITLLAILLLALACNEQVENNVKQNPSGSAEIEEGDLTSDSLNQSQSIEERTAALKEQVYQVFHYEEGDTTYLMQQYYIVFLKAGENRSQDSLETARLMEQHLAHLTRMAQEGYSSLTGPMGDDGDLRGIVVYNTATLEEADSLANLDPMVKAGRLKVEVHPWWTAKGGKLP